MHYLNFIIIKLSHDKFSHKLAKCLQPQKLFNEDEKISFIFLLSHL